MTCLLVVSLWLHIAIICTCHAKSVIVCTYLILLLPWTQRKNLENLENLSNRDCVLAIRVKEVEWRSLFVKWELHISRIFVCYICTLSESLCFVMNDDFFFFSKWSWLLQNKTQCTNDLFFTFNSFHIFFHHQKCVCYIFLNINIKALLDRTKIVRMNQLSKFANCKLYS